MKSIKPGRGPSKLNMVSAIGAAVFGVFWCVFAVAIGGRVYAAIRNYFYSNCNCHGGVFVS